MPGRFRGRGKGTLRQSGDGQGPGRQVPVGEGCGGIQVMGGDQDLVGGFRGWAQHQECTQERSRSEQSGDRPPAAVEETDECVAVSVRGWVVGVGHETTLDRGAGPFGVVHRDVFSSDAPKKRRRDPLPAAWNRGQRPMSQFPDEVPAPLLSAVLLEPPPESEEELLSLLAFPESEPVSAELLLVAELLSVR